MDLSSIDTPTLQEMLKAALASYGSGQNGARVVSANYTQGDGSKGVSFNPTSQYQQDAWVSKLQRELASRGVGTFRRTRRAIGFVYGGNGYGVW